jgi:ABC-type sulfate transport system permease component
VVGRVVRELAGLVVWPLGAMALVLAIGAAGGVGVVLYERQVLPTLTDWFLISAVVTPSALVMGLVVALWRLARAFSGAFSGLEDWFARILRARRARRRKDRGDPPILLI